MPYLADEATGGVYFREMRMNLNFPFGGRSAKGLCNLMLEKNFLG